MSPPPHRLAQAFAAALSAAQDFVGATAPNPPVGCVLLDEAGEILAVAAHQKAGGPHAEAAAIAACRAAGTVDRIHTALVTLEPCSHHGRTPPCVEALVATPVRAVWIGALDPHPRAPGAGLARLREAGVAAELIADLPDLAAVELAARAARLIAPFATLSLTGRPWISIKTALTAAGGMIPPPGRKTFTSHESLTHAHRLRREADAIITGSGCVLADDPSFTVRLVPDHPGKARHLAILDRRGRVPAAYFRAAEVRGHKVAVYDDISEMLGTLGGAGVLSVLVEAGPTLRRAFLDQDFWDEEIIFQQAPVAGEPDRVDIRLKGRTWSV